jgi:SAM-dependent methyltransferase
MRRLPDYSSITESPGLKASAEQLARMYHRYRFASDYAESKDVLEVACGSGIGLGYLAGKARWVVGGDIDNRNTRLAVYGHDVSANVLQMDAQAMPFRNRSFDLVLLYEALYYFKHPEVFVSEAKRILRDKGMLIICTVNKDWADFHPSPFVHQYLGVPELSRLLSRHYGWVEMFGAFSTATSGFPGRCASFIKQTAVRWNLIPGSLSARACLKRVFLGALQPIPDRITENMAPFVYPISICPDKRCRDYKIIYVVAQKI